MEGRWEELRGLVGGITENDNLVTGIELIKALSDIWGLLFNSEESVADLLVELETIVTLTLRTASKTWSTICSGRPSLTDLD